MAEQKQPGLADMLKEAALQASKKATEQKKRELTGECEPEESEDFNILPFPTSQSIYPDNICWAWQVSDTVEVVAVLWTKSADTSQHQKGDYYIIQRMTDDIDMSEIEWTNPIAKDFAKAMLSASNWINIWKNHAGTLLEKSFSDGQTFAR